MQSRSNITYARTRRAHRAQTARVFENGGRSACSTGAVMLAPVYYGDRARRSAVRF
jgi:hypothetical protein